MNCFKKLKKIIKDEKGVTLIEFVLIMATIGLLISILSPWFSYFMSGTADAGESKDKGFVNNVLQSQTRGLSEEIDEVEVVPGCDTTLVAEVNCP